MQHWGPYEIFSVLSGATLLVTAFVMRPAKPSERFWSIVSGVGLIGYGIYVSRQQEGTFLFPWFIFVIPLILPLMAVVRMLSKGSKEKE